MRARDDVAALRSFAVLTLHLGTVRAESLSGLAAMDTSQKDDEVLLLDGTRQLPVSRTRPAAARRACLRAALISLSNDRTLRTSRLRCSACR